MEWLIKAVFAFLMDMMGALVLMVGLGRWHDAAPQVPTIGYWTALLIIIALDVACSAALFSHSD